MRSTRRYRRWRWRGRATRCAGCQTVMRSIASRDGSGRTRDAVSPRRLVSTEDEYGLQVRCGDGDAAVVVELNAAPGRRLRMSELGQRAVLSRTRVSRVVGELATAGLAERQPDEADGRSSFAALTPAGRNALRRAWPVYRQAIRRHLGAQLTAQQCRQLAALLGQAAAGAELR